MSDQDGISRRALLAGAVAGAASLASAAHASGQPAPPASAAAAPPSPAASGGEPRHALHSVSRAPVRIDAVEVLRYEGNVFVRTRSSDGAEGVCLTNGRGYLVPILKDRVVPFFLGKDARDLETLVDLVYRRHESNYKLAGLAFWNPVGWVEISLLDMLGRIANKPVAELLGGIRRREVPIYVSSLRRDTTPEQEVERLRPRLAETGARAIKFKVGGRMSRNEDAYPGRTERLVPFLRKALGDEITMYADANGSYDVRKGIEVGRLLEAHGVAIYEEPCPFDEYEDTRQVTESLARLVVAGGEQDTSRARFRWIARNRALDLLQPDLMYNGGLMRALEVARMAAEHGLVGIAPHNPKTGAGEAHLLQFAACVPNLFGCQEYHSDPPAPEPWCSPTLAPRDGKLTLPPGPGLGITFDPAMLARAEAL